jgi:hypothetical protein
MACNPTGRQYLIGFQVTETVSVLPPNYNIPEGMDSARTLVDSGHFKWVLKAGGVLSLAPWDYKLGEWECFLTEVRPNQFLVLGSTSWGNGKEV